MSARITAPRFTEQDAGRAYDDWGANCGPGALAAILGYTLDEIRPHLGDFEEKGYVNPTLMYAILRELGMPFTRSKPPAWPDYGLVRVQWEGPWTAPNVPRRARYRYTHWVGTATSNGGRGIFDINCMNNGAGWVAFEDWQREIVPSLTALYRRASGAWHITDGVAIPLAAIQGTP